MDLQDISKNNLIARFQSTSSQLKTANNDREKLRKHNKKLRDQNAEIVAQNKDLNLLRTEREELLAQIEKLDREADGLRQKVQRRQLEASKLLREIDALKRIPTFESYLAALESENLIVYPDAGQQTMPAITYCVLGLCGESGEVAEKIKKILRDNGGEITDELRMALAKEMGDVLWYWTRLCSEVGLSPAQVAELNLAKLISRRDRGAFGGSGDER